MQDYKDGSGLPFMKFDFVTACQEIKIIILVEFGPGFQAVILSLWLTFLCFHYFWRFCLSYFKIIKQT